MRKKGSTNKNKELSNQPRVRCVSCGRRRYRPFMRVEHKYSTRRNKTTRLIKYHCKDARECGTNRTRIGY